MAGGRAASRDPLQDVDAVLGAREVAPLPDPQGLRHLGEGGAELRQLLLARARAPAPHSDGDTVAGGVVGQNERGGGRMSPTGARDFRRCISPMLPFGHMAPGRRCGPNVGRSSPIGGRRRTKFGRVPPEWGKLDQMWMGTKC